MKINKPAHWENIFMQAPIAHRSSVHGIQINNKQVMIFGGCGANDNALKETFVISFKNDTAYCEEGMKLVAASEFYRCVAPSLIDNKIYAIDHIKRIHIFKAMKWEMVSL
jgi:Galactose oxidase, central domain